MNRPFGAQPVIADDLHDGRVHLSLAYFETKSQWNEGEIQRGYNVFGQSIDTRTGEWKYHRVLRMGDGVKVCANRREMIELLDAMFPSKHLVNTNYVVYGVTALGKRFEMDSYALKPLSEQS